MEAVSEIVVGLAALVSYSEELVSLLRPYATYVLPGLLVAFFVSACVAVLLSDRLYARKLFVSCFFVALILSNFALPAPLPFVSWGHFSEPTSEVETYTEIRFVDEAGHEIKMDDRMTLTFDSVSTTRLTRYLQSGQTPAENDTRARQLLDRGSAYRERIRRGEAGQVGQFPHHGLTSEWTPSLLDDYERFVGVRIYQLTFVTSEDGTEVLEYEEQAVFESYPLADAESIPSRQSSMPTRSMNRTGTQTRTNLSPTETLAATGVFA